MGWGDVQLASSSMLNGAVDSILLSQETIFTRLEFCSTKHEHKMVYYIMSIPGFLLFKSSSILLMMF